MARHLLYHAESDCLFEVFNQQELERVLTCGEDVHDVTGIPAHEKQFKEDQMAKAITVKETFTRDQFLGRHNPQGNEVLAAQVIFSRLRQRGVPVIGVLGVIAVEWGTLTIKHDEGLDGDEWTYTWEGVPMPREWIEKCAQPGAALKLEKSLKQLIEEEDEL